jgi:carboxymethylenebutenolidase
MFLGIIGIIFYKAKAAGDELTRTAKRCNQLLLIAIFKGESTMCYTDQAIPPSPPGKKGKATGEELVLKAGDGNQFYAYLALPEGHTHSAVVIYPDVRGLHQFYRDLALRFAEVGIAAIAIDYFGRTAGLTSRAEGFDFMPHVQQIKLDTLTLDVQAALVALRDKVGAEAAVFITGFCMGGSLTLITGTNKTLGLAGLIPFYAGITRDFGGAGTVLDHAAKVAYPVVGFFGGADQSIPESAVHALDGKLSAAGVEHHLKIYPGTPHSFFDRNYDQFAGESADAWTRLLTFIQTKHPQAETA